MKEAIYCYDMQLEQKNKWGAELRLVLLCYVRQSVRDMMATGSLFVFWLLFQRLTELFIATLTTATLSYSLTDISTSGFNGIWTLYHVQFVLFVLHNTQLQWEKMGH